MCLTGERRHPAPSASPSQPPLSLGCSPSTRPNVKRPTSPRRSNEARRVEEHIGDSARSELLVHLLPALGRKQTSDRGGTESWYGAARRHEVRRSVLRRQGIDECDRFCIPDPACHDLAMQVSAAAMPMPHPLCISTVPFSGTAAGVLRRFPQGPC